jgi:hypothetical protein
MYSVGIPANKTHRYKSCKTSFLCARHNHHVQLCNVAGRSGLHPPPRCIRDEGVIITNLLLAGLFALYHSHRDTLANCNCGSGVPALVLLDGHVPQLDWPREAQAKATHVLTHMELLRLHIYLVIPCSRRH